MLNILPLMLSVNVHIINKNTCLRYLLTIFSTQRKATMPPTTPRPTLMSWAPAKTTRLIINTRLQEKLASHFMSYHVKLKVDSSPPFSVQMFMSMLVIKLFTKRVTRLGDFMPIGLLFKTFGNHFSTRRQVIWATLLSCFSK